MSNNQNAINCLRRCGKNKRGVFIRSKELRLITTKTVGGKEPDGWFELMNLANCFG
jgi:DNA-directed RNA polymerase alpha subunit